MDGVRAAALMLHGLDGQDRDWMLSQLPPDDRSRLAPLLAELAQIGISKDSARSHSRLASNRARNESVAPITPLGRLRRADANALFAVLDREPVAFVAACVRADEWPWRDALLARLDARRRAEVVDLLRESTDMELAPRMRETLLAKLDGRLQAGSASSGKRKGLAKFRSWMEARWKKT